MSVLAPLAPLRAHAGQRLTSGLDDASVERLAANHPDLAAAIAAAAAEYASVREAAADLLDLELLLADVDIDRAVHAAAAKILHLARELGQLEFFDHAHERLAVVEGVEILEAIG